MQKIFWLLGIIIGYFNPLTAQGYDDYIGAGHSEGITVTSSSDFTDPKWSEIASGDKTINGAGLEGALMEASRFLSQAAIGAEEKTLNEVAAIGIEAWIDRQMTQSPTSYLDLIKGIFNDIIQHLLAEGEDPEDLPSRPNWAAFRYAWWTATIEGDDILRQRMAKALSEILVISDESNLDGFGDALAGYYDLLSKHAFGNYKDLLLDVTLHPAMGFYLSHLNNPKANEEENTHPDQNYAREIMQLFTIGLYELNQDGTRKKDNNGDWIATYTNTDIIELADVFTGLGVGALLDTTRNLFFGNGIWNADMTTPMIMYPEWHEPSSKRLLNDYVIPANQDGLKDINDAVTHLFNHPNVGPFIAKRLIQQLVKSNPTPQYISRIASVFNDDGTGVRGNLGAVLKAILLDIEARDCEWIHHSTQGKLREPIDRLSQFIKALNYESPSEKFWMNSWNFARETGQFPLSSPSVFNFFQPNYQPVGDLSDAQLLAPEFQIYNSITAIGYANQVFRWTYYESIGGNWLSEEYDVYTDLSHLIQKSRDPEVLCNHLDLYIMNGQMSDRTRRIIKTALNEIVPTLDGLVERIYLATYLVMISPEYTILK